MGKWRKKNYAHTFHWRLLTLMPTLPAAMLPVAMLPAAMLRGEGVLPWGPCGEARPPQAGDPGEADSLVGLLEPTSVMTCAVSLGKRPISWLFGRQRESPQDGREVTTGSRRARAAGSTARSGCRRAGRAKEAAAKGCGDLWAVAGCGNGCNITGSVPILAIRVSDLSSRRGSALQSTFKCSAAHAATSDSPWLFPSRPCFRRSSCSEPPPSLLRAASDRLAESRTVRAPPPSSAATVSVRGGGGGAAPFPPAAVNER